jgi:hypothetical protein
MKICELKIQDMVSVNSIIQALLLNGYSVKSSTKFKEFPRETQIDYFSIEISDCLTEEGGDQNAR